MLEMMENHGLPKNVVHLKLSDGGLLIHLPLVKNHASHVSHVSHVSHATKRSALNLVKAESHVRALANHVRAANHVRVANHANLAQSVLSHASHVSHVSHASHASHVSHVRAHIRAESQQKLRRTKSNECGSILNRSSWAKYYSPKRKSPPFPATNCEGEIKLGRDWEWWIAERKGKSIRWVRYTDGSVDQGLSTIIY